MQIQIFSDIACPWCYIGRRRFQKALETFEHKDQVQVEFKTFQLDPTVPDFDERSHVQYLAETKGMDPGQVQQMFQHVAAQAKTESLDMNFDSVVNANSWRAHRLIQRAKAVSTEVARGVEEALFAAYFVQGKNIGDDQVLQDCGVTGGLSPEQVSEALTEGQWETAATADVAQAREFGITGVPFFVVDNKYSISGAQPAELFTQALERAWAEKRQKTSD